MILTFENEPLPDEVQVIEEYDDADAVVTGKLEVSQMVASEPAFAAGAEIIVSSIELELVCETQGATPAQVKVNVTLPLAMSTELGV